MPASKTATKSTAKKVTTVKNNQKKVQVKQVVYSPKMDGQVKNLVLKVKYNLKKHYGLTASTADKQIRKEDFAEINKYVDETIALVKDNYNLPKADEDLVYIRNHFDKHLMLKTIK